MLNSILKIIQAVKERDPASSSSFWVVLLYPSVHVMIFYYISRFLWLRNIRSIARLIMQIARFLTGIEIHPGAKIGDGFFMDHAMGIVIGETAEIGDNVTIYHGVTLGGIMPAFKSDEQRGIKRHPTLEDGVIIGSGAQILGPITIGANARVGANSVVLKSVSKGMSVVGVPAHEVGKNKLSKDFQAYGTAFSEVSKIDKSISRIDDEINSLKEKISNLEREIQFSLLPKDKDDTRNVILEVRAGTGGDEAGLFASNLFSMYEKLSIKNKWRFEVMEVSETSVGGYKEAQANIIGFFAIDLHNPFHSKSPKWEMGLVCGQANFTCFKPFFI